MSLSLVRPFFRTRLKALGYHEHEGGFNFEEIPSTLRDNAFHLESGEIDPVGAAHLTYNINYNITVRIFKRAFNKIHEGLDNVDVIRDTIYADILKPSTRLGLKIKNIVPGSSRSLAIGESNDKSIMIEFEFNALVIQCYV